MILWFANLDNLIVLPFLDSLNGKPTAREFYLHSVSLLTKPNCVQVSVNLSAGSSYQCAVCIVNSANGC